MTKIPFGTITVTPRSKALIRQILKTNRFSSGKYVRQFEEGFAELTGAKEAVALSSGTDAVALCAAALYDFGARRQDEIIVPALSFVASANAVLQAGFKPVFVDVAADTLNIQVKDIEKAISKKTRAILAVHLMGKPAAMKEIMSIAKKYRLFVIGDAAEAHGAVYRGKNIGLWGDMVAFSLYVAHIITTVEGGIVTTNDEKKATILRSLRSHGRACKCKSCVLNKSSSFCSKRFNNPQKEDIRFLFERVGFSAKMNELEAAIGLGNLDIYEDILKKRRKNLYYLMNEFGVFEPFLTTFKKEAWEEIGPHAFPFIVGKRAGFSRNDLLHFLEQRGIDARTLFSSIPTQCGGYEFCGHKPGDFPQAEHIGSNGLHIGVHQEMGRKECDYFLEVIRDFIKKRRLP